MNTLGWQESPQIISDLSMVIACLNNANDHLLAYKNTKDEYHIKPLKIFIERASKRLAKVQQELDK